jgi:hypothetical protein
MDRTVCQIVETEPFLTEQSLLASWVIYRPEVLKFL